MSCLVMHEQCLRQRHLIPEVGSGFNTCRLPWYTNCARPSHLSAMAVVSPGVKVTATVAVLPLIAAAADTPVGAVAGPTVTEAALASVLRLPLSLRATILMATM